MHRSGLHVALFDTRLRLCLECKWFFIQFVQYSGPYTNALAYVEWLRADERFSDLLVQISPSRNGHAFPKLKLRYKPSLVQVKLYI